MEKNNLTEKGDSSNLIFWAVVIIATIAITLNFMGDRPDRELTPQEKSGNVSICHQYYGNGQEYQDCVNGRYGKD